MWFLTKLCGRSRKQNMFIICEGAAIQRSEVVKAFLKEHPGQIHLERIPTYSPQLDPAADRPAELIWSSLKNQQGHLSSFF